MPGKYVPPNNARYCRKCGAELTVITTEVKQGFDRYDGHPLVETKEEAHCPVYMALGQWAQFKDVFAQVGHYPNDDPKRPDFLDRHVGLVVLTLIVGLVGIGVVIGVAAGVWLL